MTFSLNKSIRFVKFAFHYLKKRYHEKDKPEKKYEITGENKVTVHPTTYIDKDVVIHSGGNRDKIEISANVSIYKRVELSTWFDQQLTIKPFSSVQDGCKILGDVTIEKYNLFSCNIFMSSGRHYSDFKPEFIIKDQDQMVLNDPILLKEHSNPIHIEEDCWIGWGAFIKQGVTIGKGSVVGAYSVVTKSIEPYSVVAGTPAKLIRKRLDFQPQQDLMASNPHSFPYFYRGFGLSAIEREVCGKEGLLMELVAFVALKKSQEYEIDITNSNSFEAKVRISSPQCESMIEVLLTAGKNFIKFSCGNYSNEIENIVDGISMPFFIENNFMIIKFENITKPHDLSINNLIMNKISSL